MNVNKRAIAIALSSSTVVGLATIPALSQRPAVNPPVNKITGVGGKTRGLLGPVNRGATLRKRHKEMSPGGDGNIAGATTSFATCFEAPYAPGNINGQQGWIAIPATAAGTTIVNTGSLEGSQSLQVANGGAPGTLSGAETPTVGVVGPGRFVVTFTANIGAVGGADYVVDAISNTELLVAAKMHFFYADLVTAPGQTGDADADPGDIIVLDDLGAGLQFVSTGAEYTPGVSAVYRMEIDQDANRIKYFKGNDLIYIGKAVSPDVGVEAVDFYSDNFQLAETGKFDCLSVEAAHGLCSGDIVRNNNVDVNDLLAVVTTWGPCQPLPSNCAADINPNNNVDVNDLLGVITTWGPCLAPTGACCSTTGSCTPGQSYAACVGVSGVYSGNGTNCSPNNCPQPANNDHIAGAIDITANINGAPVNGNNGVATPVQHDGNPGGADPEIPAGSPSCQWALVPTDTHNTVWYKFTAPAGGAVTLSTCSSVAPFVDSILVVYSGTPGSLVEVVCAEDTGCPGFMSTAAATGLTPGQVYYVMVGNPGSWTGSDPGAFVLTAATPAPNDVCGGATVISFPFSQSVNVSNYTPDMSPGSLSTCVAGVFTMDGSWWYRFTAASTTTVSVSTCASPNEDTLVTAYSGSCAGLIQVGCDDDFCTAPAFGGSQFTFNVTAGTTYFLHFETYSGGIAGPVSVSITSP